MNDSSLLQFSLSWLLSPLPPYCSFETVSFILVLYLLFSFSTCSLLLNPVDHSAVVVVSANQLLQENWLRENLTLL
jgi:hypothetical protein